MWLVDEDCALQTLHVAIACFHVTVLAHEFACWGHVVFFGLSSCIMKHAMFATNMPSMPSQTLYGIHS